MTGRRSEGRNLALHGGVGQEEDQNAQETDVSSPTPHKEETVPHTDKEAVRQADEEIVWQADEDDQEEAGGTGSGSSGFTSVYLRGPTSLPYILSPLQRLVLTSKGIKSWTIVSSGTARNPNGILGLLTRRHYPGIVEYAERHEPAYSYDHYAAAPDPDHPNKTLRVKAEFWVQLKEERRQRQLSKARTAAQLENERLEREAQARRLADLTAFLQGLGQTQGFTLPASLLAPPPPLPPQGDQGFSTQSN